MVKLSIYDTDSNCYPDLRHDIAAVKIQLTDYETTLNARFMIPYQRNANFIGRTDLLIQLRAKLCDIIPKSWNHRVALHGLGGIGKTQLALEYAYTYKDDYERIYWISGISEASLVSGFQEISKRAKCQPKGTEVMPSETAKQVLEWLNSQDSCLLVVDNLDEIEVIDGYLPSPSPGRHTLITTRNPFSDQIPAEGLQVEELEDNDAVDLLLLRSGMRMATDKATARLEAAEIVKELGYLPLAIEQAAAYIREVLTDVSKFLPLYSKDRKKHLDRTSKANRNYYSKSVGTTWRMSFTQIAENNPDAQLLLQLLSFLNPDGILTDFIELGASGLPDKLKDVVTDAGRFYEALSEIERFSLIAQQSDSKSGQRIIVHHGNAISIHRLVQIVIQDEMSEDTLQEMWEVVISLCNASFPSEITDYNLSQCRQYQNQVLLPLSTAPLMKSKKL